MQLVGESVAAVSGTQWNYDFLAFPGNRPNWVPKWGFKTEAPTFDPRFDIGGQFGGWHYGVKAYGGYGGDMGSDGEAKRGPDVNQFCDFAGVFGTGIHVTGVAGTSVEHIGVYGQSGEGPVADFLIGGVVGAAARTHGVVGWSNEQWGVVGTSYAPMGVGVFGDGAYGVLGTSGPFGPLTFPGFTTKPGVFGTSAHQAGLVGTSDDLMGVYGYSTNNAGIVGQSGNTNSYGGFFFGDVMVTRDLTVQRNLTVGGVISPNPKAAVVPFPDGTQRLLYCMESPEVWFEDFGTARLKRGRAVVRLDPDFGRVIKRNNYRVFITPEGDCRGLYVRRKHAASFEVRELAGGKSSVTFSYRIVAHRKDIRGYTRFAKIDPRFAKLDKPLELPIAATRASRQGASAAAALRKIASSMGKGTRARRARGMKARRLRALRKRFRA